MYNLFFIETYIAGRELYRMSVSSVAFDAVMYADYNFCSMYNRMSFPGQRQVILSERLFSRMMATLERSGLRKYYSETCL